MFADLWAKLVSDSYFHLGSTSPCLISDEALNLSERDPFFPRELPSPLLPPHQPRSSSINWVAETAIMKKGKKELQCGKKRKQDRVPWVSKCFALSSSGSVATTDACVPGFHEIVLLNYNKFSFFFLFLKLTRDGFCHLQLLSYNYYIL